LIAETLTGDLIVLSVELMAGVLRGVIGTGSSMLPMPVRAVRKVMSPP
jgi:hypothetical protein